MPAQNWDIKKLKSMIDVNLIGALHTLDVILPVFMKKNSGHLVFTGSLVGYRGLPGALGYGSSKAALVNLGETLRYDLKDTAIKVQLINPGFVKTRLTDKNKFKMLQIMSPEVAAGKMFSNMNKNSFSSSFPAPFSWLFRVSQLLPDSIYFKLF
jgi:short-subunit dehydrogenase